MFRNLSLCLTVCLGAIAFQTTASAQDSILTELYGSGVHSYFAGDYARAKEDLSSAIDGGTKDPRPYYFRGMANMKLGQDDAARADFKRGAELESADINGFYPVSRSLERIQGSQRLMIERQRTVARAASHAREERRNAMRYEQRRRAEAAVLRKAEATLSAAEAEATAVQAATGVEPAPEAPAPKPGEEAPAEEAATEKVDMPAEGEEPATEEEAGEAAEPAAEKAEEAMEEESDPFGGDEPAAKAAPAAGVPVVVPPAAATEKTEPEPEAEAADPFGGTDAEPKAASPAAPAAPATPPAPEPAKPVVPPAPPKPAGAAPAEEEVKDPFGDDAGSAATAPAEKPADKPADKPAADKAAADEDPFAE